MGPYSSSVSTVVRTVTVNPAFLQEIKEVHQGLWDALSEMRQRCQRPIAIGMCRHLVNWLEEIRDQLALHFALEEAYGYFEDPVDAAPHLCQMADSLRAQHHDLYQSFCDMLDHADQLLFEEKLAELALWLGPAFLTFDRILRRHETLENELIFEAYADIGGSD